MTTLRTTGILTLAVVAAVALTLLGTPDDTARPDADGLLEVSLQDYRFQPAELALPTGEPVTLRLVNRDDPGHHVAFGRDVEVADGRAVGFREDLLAGLDVRVEPTGARVDDGGPVEVLVRGHQTVEVTFVLPADRAGSWELGCFTGRGCHYRTGLAARLIVE